ncbi:hypothetical protein [Amycolatopsis sp. NPDC051071]|uniref:hypothetical protein n=1 Tax=Amycolatopsis sp. NPDC051071 TaxID=3154637 RepID=UPI003418D68F
MTVHARRYGRWCREHFDTQPESGQEKKPAEQAVAANGTDIQAEQAQAGDVPPGEPGSLN